MSFLGFGNFTRNLSVCKSLLSKVSLTKRKGKSSQEWILRQLSDPYIEKAKMLNYRCRSAFKLIEMNESAQFLSPGQVVVDIGAAPGSWTQVAVEKVNANKANPSKPQGAVFSIDRLQIYPIEGAQILSNLDFESEEAQQKLMKLLNGAKVDVVISDIAPNATGIRYLDQDGIISLCYRAFRFAAQVSKKDATLLVKVWDGDEVPVLEMDLGRFYKSVKVMKPKASRSDSTEKFLLARGFKGLQE